MIYFPRIQVLRALAANAVALSHLAIIEQKYSATTLLPRELISAGHIGVNCFFVVSGFIMANIVQREPSARRFLLARISRIYPTYWFYTVIVLAIFWTTPAIVNSSATIEPTLWKSFLLWPDAALPLLNVGWSLIYEMWFYLVLFGAIVLRLDLAIVLCVWTIALIFAPSATTPETAVVFSPLGFLFIAGAAVGLLVNSGFKRGRAAALAIGCVALVAGTIFWLRSYQVGIETAWIWMGLPFALIVYGCSSPGSSKADKSLIEDLGDASYSLYLGHILTLSALGRLYSLYPGRSSIVGLFFLLTCMIAANIAAIFSYRLLERPLIAAVRSQAGKAHGSCKDLSINVSRHP
ncbi:acyltransferase [Bradyrhizobium sp. LHD-71]|uniref:acyltransferase family protein n=1 Tax=Bradyrhizobium sp. LHD-71 TaxID=3072141 RepID=UPI00280F2F25|nr:acyltransferase [Bradyrhizobium sp. LHD-71]MDQ8729109.1 acyltransferase [Bradyrhizobium sp. LHD-71]